MHRGAFFQFPFTTITIINPPERKLAKRTPVHWFEFVGNPYLVTKCTVCTVFIASNVVCTLDVRMDDKSESECRREKILENH